MKQIGFIKELNGKLYIKRKNEIYTIEDLSTANKEILEGDILSQESGISLLIVNDEEHALKAGDKILNNHNSKDNKFNVFDEFKKLFNINISMVKDQVAASKARGINKDLSITAIPFNDKKITLTKPIFYIKTKIGNNFELEVKDSKGEIVFNEPKALANKVIECEKKLDFEEKYTFIVKEDGEEIIKKAFEIASKLKVETLNENIEALKQFSSGSDQIEEIATYLLVNDYNYEAKCYLLKEYENNSQIFTPSLLFMLSKLGYPKNEKASFAN